MPIKVMLLEAAGPWLASRPDMKDLEQIVLPHGLMQLSADLKEHLGDKVQVAVRHSFGDYNSDQELAAELDRFDPDVVGIRGLHVYRKRFKELASLIKSRGKKTLLLAGGPFPTISPRQALQTGVDAVVIGEGDMVLPSLVQRLNDGKDFRDLPGIGYTHPGHGVVINPGRRFLQDMNALPFPDYDCLDLGRYERYLTYGYNRRRQGVILSSRGCPYRCAYCHNLFGSRFRPRSADSVVAEMKLLNLERGIKDFYFIDDGFNLDRTRVERFCSLLSKQDEQFNLYFANGLRADLLDTKLVDMLVEAGMVWVTYALETASNRLQRLIRKNLNLEKLKLVTEYTISKGVMVNLCFMIGLPSETKEEALSTLRFVKAIQGLVLPMFFTVKYYPNTDIFRIGLEHGLNLPKDDSAFDAPYHDIGHFGTPTLPAGEIRELYFRFLKEIFLSRPRLEQAMEIQGLHMTDQEILDMYSLLLRRRIRDVEKELIAVTK
ncbi:MAG: B12-binding domain-containing radical SAM protein [Deltaproteobacteria bacterium]|nr:B12-binding domain-containing radical SAM protein [Deltaproteobacteria bacterium]